jgi:hypothetical protein
VVAGSISARPTRKSTSYAMSTGAFVPRVDAM